MPTTHPFLFVTLVVALFLVPTASAQAEQPEDPEPTEPGDAGAAPEDTRAGAGHAVYDIDGRGRWKGIVGPLRYDVEAPVTVLDAEGRIREAQAVAIAYPRWANETWELHTQHRLYGADDGRWLASVQEQWGEDEYQPALPGLLGTRSESSRIVTYVPSDLEDCLVLPDHHDDYRCSLPMWPHQVWTARRVRNDWSAGDPPVVVVQGWVGDWLFEARHDPSAAVATRVEVAVLGTAGPSFLDLDLREHEDWRGEAAAPSRAVPVLQGAPAQDLLDVLFGPSEAGWKHSFPLSMAVQELMAGNLSAFDRRGSNGCGTDGPDFADWFDVHHRPFVYHAEHHRLEGARVGHEWLLGFSDGHETFWVLVARIDDADMRGPELERALCTDAEGAALAALPLGDYAYFIDRPSHIDDHIPSLDELRSTFPTAHATSVWWKAYAGHEEPTSYGFHIGCTGCPRGTWDLWAGADTIRSTHQDPVGLYLGYDKTFARNTSLLHIDAAGRATEFVHILQQQAEGTPPLPPLPGMHAGRPHEAAPVDEAARPAPSGNAMPFPGVGIVVALGLAAFACRRRH